MKKFGNTRAYLRTRHLELTRLIVVTRDQASDKENSVDVQAYTNALIVKMEREKVEIEDCLREIGMEITITKEDVCQM